MMYIIIIGLASHTARRNAKRKASAGVGPGEAKGGGFKGSADPPKALEAGS